MIFRRIDIEERIMLRNLEADGAHADRYGETPDREGAAIARSNGIIDVMSKAA